METAIAFGVAAVITLFFQTVHWVVRRQRADAPGWGEWLVSADAWMTGWPIALSIGAYIVTYLLMQAARTPPLPH